MCPYVVLSQGPSDSLGISLAGGVGNPHNNVPLAAMDTDGLAAKTQQLQVESADLWEVCVLV